jgi:hypothetical protein
MIQYMRRDLEAIRQAAEKLAALLEEAERFDENLLAGERPSLLWEQMCAMQEKFGLMRAEIETLVCRTEPGVSREREQRKWAEEAAASWMEANAA